VVSRGTLTRRLTAAAAALLSVGLLAACGSSSSSSSSSTTSSNNTIATNGPGGSSGAAGEAQCNRNKAVGNITYISPFGYDAAAGLMDVFVAEHLGYFKDLCLDVSINASAQNGQQLVSSGRAQFTSIGSAADDLLAKANGANITAIATDGAQDPHAIYTQAKITSLKQLEGGTLGYHINVTPAADAMLVAAGADPKKVKFLSLTSYDPTVVTRGQIDGAIGYASNEPNELKLAHQKFNEFLPSQYGVGGTYTVMQVNTSWYNKNRAVAADWMRADLKALQYCITNQAVCVKYMTGLAAANGLGKAFPPDLETKVWATESSYVLKNNGLPPGVQTYSEWQPSVTLVTKYGGAKHVPPLQQVMDPTLVASLYKGSVLIWPSS
jgi:ABC-type nitrate/sulfonate/bicarbonate transport system substrate-binding protein